jgi:outer membrane biosynthesis protein TonB
MATKIHIALRTSVAALLLMTLSACDKSQPEVPAPAPAPAETPAPDATPVPAPGAETPPSDTAVEPAQPESTPPPPEEPSAVPKPTAAHEPAVESMRVAQPSAKLGVAVDLRYQFDAEPLPNQPVTLHLAAVPRVGGSNLRVSVKPAAGLQLASTEAIQIQKASAAGIYRQQMSVTRAAGGPQSLRVLVTMDMGEGVAFGYYAIPLAGGTTAQKLDSVKQR